jgi:PAS domain S-box-containing protein
LLSDITNKLAHDDLIADVETVLDKLQPIEREVKTENNNIYLMQITPYRTSEDRISGTVISFVNITKNKRQEIELRELNERIEQQAKIFNVTLSTITDFAYTFDKDGRFMFANQPLLDLLEISLEEIIGKNFYDLNYPEELSAHLQDQVQQIFDTKKTLKDETPFTFPVNGVKGFYEYIFNPVIAADGSVELVAGSTRDITERKQREAHLEFLSEFSQDMILLKNASEIMKVFGERISRLTNASVCAFLEIDEEKDEAVVSYEWHLNEGFILSGKYIISELVSNEFQKLMAVGKAVVVRDIKNDPFINGKEQLASYGIGSFINVLLIRNGQWKFVLGIYHDYPYDWRDDEVELLIETVNRIWTKLERINVNDKLYESEERLQVLVNNLPGGAVFVVDHDLRYLLAAGEALAAADMKPENLVGKTIFEVLPPELTPKYEELYRKALAGETFIHEHDAHGGTFVSHGNPLRSANGNVYAALAVSYDITERKITEEKLRKSEEWLSLIVRSVRDYAIITLDTNGIINGWNPGAEKMFGYTESEILGRNTEILFTLEDRENDVPEKEIQKAIRNGGADDERFHLHKDGSQFYVSGVMQPIKNGRINGFVKIARDLTERLKAEKTLKDKEILQRLVGTQEDERKRIARNLHDELGQLLTALRLKLESVKQLTKDNTELSDKVDETQLFVKQIDLGIDFLAWELRPAALDDLGLYSALIKYVREWSHYSGITGELLDSSLKRARFTHEVEINLYRIAQESLNNVYKHSEAKLAEVSIEKRGDLIVLIIQDNGRGFNPKDKMNRDKGIGLIGMKERAALIGGSLEIESAPAEGTRIFVRVPITQTDVEYSDEK